MEPTEANMSVSIMNSGICPSPSFSPSPSPSSDVAAPSPGPASSESMPEMSMLCLLMVSG